MLPFLAPESGSDANESPIHRDDIVKFLIDGKMVTAEEAESAYPLDEEGAAIWDRKIHELHSAQKISARLGEKILKVASGKEEENDADRIDSLRSILKNGYEQGLEKGLYGEIPTTVIGGIPGEMSPARGQTIGLSEDPNKLWESATPEQFRENGKYNQISLLDDGRFFLTIIKPGAVESIPLQVDPEFVEPIREYLKKNPLNWDSANEGWKNGYNDLGGVYEFFRVIPLLRTAETWIDLKWHGQHTNPVIAGGPFAIKDSAEISVRPVSYTETE